MKDQYIRYQNQPALIAGPTYDALIQTQTQHPNITHFTVILKQLGYVGEPVTILSETYWQTIILPNHSTAFTEVKNEPGNHQR